MNKKESVKKFLAGSLAWIFLFAPAASYANNYTDTVTTQSEAQNAETVKVVGDDKPAISVVSESLTFGNLTEISTQGKNSPVVLAGVENQSVTINGDIKISSDSAIGSHGLQSSAKNAKITVNGNVSTSLNNEGGFVLQALKGGVIETKDIKINSTSPHKIFGES